MGNTYIFWSVLQRFFVQKQEKEHSKNPKRMTFENNGRSGYAIFWDGDKATKFYMELGGGDCMFFVNIPSQNDWSSHTGYSLNQRDEILKFVAEESLSLQSNSPESYYKIEEKWISFFQK